MMDASTVRKYEESRALVSGVRWTAIFTRSDTEPRQRAGRKDTPPGRPCRATDAGRRETTNAHAHRDRPRSKHATHFRGCTALLNLQRKKILFL